MFLKIKSENSIHHIDQYSILKNLAIWSQIYLQRRLEHVTFLDGEKRQYKEHETLSLLVGEGVLHFLRMFCMCHECPHVQHNRLVETFKPMLLLPFLANEKCFLIILKEGKWIFREQRGVSNTHVWGTSSPKKKMNSRLPHKWLLSCLETLLYSNLDINWIFEFTSSTIYGAPTLSKTPIINHSFTKTKHT